eukprot:8991885-Pyramimonas_sp.AAC.1
MGADFDAYIDDAELSRTGTASEGVEALTTRPSAPAKEVLEVLGCVLALDASGARVQSPRYWSARRASRPLAR